MVAKAGLGLLGLSAIGIGGVAFAKPEWLGINKEVEWKPLASDGDFSNTNTGYSGKFGGTYKYYFVGVKGNQDWWKESFERLKKDSSSNTKPSDQFKCVTDGDKKITDAFATSESDGGDKTLNQICKKVYKAETSKVTSNGAESGEYKEADVWKYCSGLGQKPTTVKEFDNKDTSPRYKDNGGTKPIGKEEEESLISVHDEKNNKFWEIRDKEFRGKEPFTPKPTFDTTNDLFFKAGQESNKKIKDLCKEAYDKNSSETSSKTSPAKAETKKYCSLTLEKS